MDASLAFRASALQALLVVALSLVLALALPRSFFESWGWVSGPLAWLACAALTARLLRMPLARTIFGAALVGPVSLLALLAGAHWLGVAMAVIGFGLWCGLAIGGSARRPTAPAGDAGP